MSLIKLGKQGENIASSYLQSRGFTVIGQNYRTPSGEIDLIARRNLSLYFIEVKTRSSTVKGKPYEAVNGRKIRHMKNSAAYYLLKNAHKEYKLKLAVISIILTDGKIVRLDFFEDL